MVSVSGQIKEIRPCRGTWHTQAPRGPKLRPKIGARFFGPWKSGAQIWAPIWGSDLGPDLGPRFGSKFGSQIGAKFGVQFLLGPKIWAQIWDSQIVPNLGSRAARPKCPGARVRAALGPKFGLQQMHSILGQNLGPKSDSKTGPKFGSELWVLGPTIPWAQELGPLFWGHSLGVTVHSWGLQL